jgi:hypothetical protein
MGMRVWGGWWRSIRGGCEMWMKREKWMYRFCYG